MSSSKSKKRKSSQIKTSGNSLDRLATPSTITIQVANLENDESKAPIVCSFPSGIPESLQDTNETTGNPSKPPKFSLQQTKLKAPKKGTSHSLIGKDDTCIYSASVVLSKSRKSSVGGTGENSITNIPLAKGQRSKMLVGVLDKKTGTLTLHEAAASGNVFSLNQSVPCYQFSQGDTKMTTVERYQALVRDFGSAKKQKVTKSQEANKVNVDLVVGAGNVLTNKFLKHSVTSESSRKAVEAQRALGTGNSTPGYMSTSLTRSANQATQNWRQKFLPPFNLKADHPHLVYNFKESVGESAWGSITRIVDACLHNQELDAIEALLRDPKLNREGKVPKPKLDPKTNEPVAPVHIPRGDYWNESVRLVLDKLKGKNLSKSSSPMEKDQLKCTVLLNHFLNLIHLLQRKRSIIAPDGSRSRFYGSPSAVGMRFLELFGTSLSAGKYAISRANVDCCYVHLLLMYLMADGGATMRSNNIRVLIDDLQVDTAKAIHLLKEAGCTVKKERSGNKLSAFLTTPLTFPEARKVPPKKR